MKKGFTMIELIFVIVILGILAAIAIPKLAATRDDARAASIKSDIGTAVQSIPAWFTSRQEVAVAGAMSIDTSIWKKGVDGTNGCEYTYTDSYGGKIVMDIKNGTSASASSLKTCPEGNSSAYGSNPTLTVKLTSVAGGVVDLLKNDMKVSDRNVSLKGSSVKWGN